MWKLLTSSGIGSGDSLSALFVDIGLIRPRKHLRNVDDVHVRSGVQKVRYVTLHYYNRGLITLGVTLAASITQKFLIRINGEWKCLCA